MILSRCDNFHCGSPCNDWGCYLGPDPRCECPLGKRQHEDGCPEKDTPRVGETSADKPPETKIPGVVYNGIRYHPGTAAATRARDLLLAEIAAAGGKPTHTCIGADGTAVAYFGKATITFEPDETHSGGGRLYVEACVAVDDKP